ncbi:MAG: Cof-type HAD-IIB family hydrolase [Caldilineaceae bacterium]|nr:Cof-type HAD-IIB family hydrolase [Caldilineaceae bacterium]
MQPPAYDLVVLDLDGTILEKEFEGGYSLRVRQAIGAVQALGVPVTIATGRTLDFVRTQTPLLGITTPVVTTQGAVVGDPVSGEIFYEADMPLDVARSVAAWADATGRVTIFYFSNRDGTTTLYQNREVWQPAVYDHWFGTPRRIQPNLSELLGARDHPPLKFISVNDASAEPDLTPLLQEQFGPTMQMTRTHALLIEGTAAGVDKGAGLLHLLERLSIAPHRVLAVGDNENDIPMLKLAGMGVAMGQATEKVKTVARWIAPSVFEDGAAVAMERFVIGRI